MSLLVTAVLVGSCNLFRPAPTPEATPTPDPGSIIRAIGGIGGVGALAAYGPTADLLLKGLSTGGTLTVNAPTTLSGTHLHANLGYTLNNRNIQLNGGNITAGTAATTCVDNSGLGLCPLGKPKSLVAPLNIPSPNYASLLQSHTPTTFGKTVTATNVNTAAQLATLLQGSNGSLKVTGNLNLNFPATLENQVLVVDGAIKFNNGVTLKNAKVIAQSLTLNGNTSLEQTRLLAQDLVLNNGLNLKGLNTLATASSLTLNGALSTQANPANSPNLPNQTAFIAQQNITLNGGSGANLRAWFWAGGNFTNNPNTNLSGGILAKGKTLMNGPLSLNKASQVDNLDLPGGGPASVTTELSSGGTIVGPDDVAITAPQVMANKEGPISQPVPITISRLSATDLAKPLPFWVTPLGLYYRVSAPEILDINGDDWYQIRIPIPVGTPTDGIAVQGLVSNEYSTETEPPHELTWNLARYSYDPSNHILTILTTLIVPAPDGAVYAVVLPKVPITTFTVPIVTGTLVPGGTLVGPDEVTINAPSDIADKDGVAITSVSTTIARLSLADSGYDIPGLPKPLGLFYYVSTPEITDSGSGLFTVRIPIPVGVSSEQIGAMVRLSTDFGSERLETPVLIWEPTHSAFDPISRLLEVVFAQIPPSPDGIVIAVVSFGVSSKTNQVNTTVRVQQDSFRVTCSSGFTCVENTKSEVAQKVNSSIGDFTRKFSRSPNLRSVFFTLETENPCTIIIKRPPPADPIVIKILGKYTEPNLFICVNKDGVIIAKSIPNVVRHETFHALQAAYRPVFQWPSWILEGTATASTQSQDIMNVDVDSGFVARGVGSALIERGSDQEYRVQDFWVFLGRSLNNGVNQNGKGLEYLRSIFESPFVKLVEIDSSIGDVNKVGYSGGLSQVYWDWVKNQAIEKTIDFRNRGNKCDIKSADDIIASSRASVSFGFPSGSTTATHTIKSDELSPLQSKMVRLGERYVLVSNLDIPGGGPSTVTGTLVPGGTLVGPDEVTISAPPGVLEQPVQITIERVDPASLPVPLSALFTPVTPFYRILPIGAPEVGLVSKGFGSFVIEIPAPRDTGSMHVLVSGENTADMGVNPDEFVWDVDLPTYNSSTRKMSITYRQIPADGFVLVIDYYTPPTNQNLIVSPQLPLVRTNQVTDVSIERGCTNAATAANHCISAIVDRVFSDAISARSEYVQALQLSSNRLPLLARILIAEGAVDCLNQQTKLPNAGQYRNGVLRICLEANGSFVSTNVARTIRHEVFHSVQGAFFTFTLPRVWFTESTATAVASSSPTSMNIDDRFGIRKVAAKLEETNGQINYNTQDFWVFLGKNFKPTEKGYSFFRPILDTELARPLSNVDTALSGSVLSYTGGLGQAY